MFIVSLNYICDLADVETHLDAHIQYLDRHYAAGVFLASGRKVPRTGGVILAQADSRTALDAILAEDPFKIHQLAEYEVTEFIPTKTSPALEFLAS
ncbi:MULTISPECIES: YciI family protein [unclassified Agarivorans]|uniref:YciI family protein n=1 Tax=unclassified Agarivorans TaxID=2636026 RepID=UPI003D7CA422